LAAIATDFSPWCGEPTVDGIGVVDALDGVAAHGDAAEGAVRVIFVFGVAFPQHAVVGGVDGREAVVAVVGIAVGGLILAVGLTPYPYSCF